MLNDAELGVIQPNIHGYRLAKGPVEPSQHVCRHVRCKGSMACSILLVDGWDRWGRGGREVDRGEAGFPQPHPWLKPIASAECHPSTPSFNNPCHFSITTFRYHCLIFLSFSNHKLSPTFTHTLALPQLCPFPTPSPQPFNPFTTPTTLRTITMRSRFIHQARGCCVLFSLSLFPSLAWPAREGSTH